MLELTGSKYAGFWGLMLLILNIWAIVSIVSSNATTGRKALWILLVLLLPLLGFVVWLITGPRASN